MDRIRSKSNAVRGQVVRRLPKGLFRVKTEEGTPLVAHIPAGYRTGLIRVLEGDRVRVRLCQADRSRAMILGRLSSHDTRRSR